MPHLIAPSSTPEVEPTSIQSSSQKGMHAHHPKLSRSRRDTPSFGALPAFAVIFLDDRSWVRKLSLVESKLEVG
jgi:hypothetical protein